MTSIINNYGFIDYKKPTAEKDDFRTSSYIGHRYMSDVGSGNLQVDKKSDSDKIYSNRSKVKDNYVSETANSYTLKLPEASKNRNTRLTCENILYIKPYDTVKFKNVPRPLEEYQTVYRNEYYPKSKCQEEFILPKMPQKKPLEKSTVPIDSEKSGHTKYLDMMASSNKLDYPKYSINTTKGISEKNNITLWNWMNMYQSKYGAHKEYPSAPSTSNAPEVMCANFCSAQCPKRRNEFPSLIKHVPNNGLTTETRDNYLRPDKEYDAYLANLQQPWVQIPPKTIPPWSTETSIYGSGDCVNKFIDIKVKNSKNRA